MVVLLLVQLESFVTRKVVRATPEELIIFFGGGGEVLLNNSML